jgi:ribosomal protein L37E
MEKNNETIFCSKCGQKNLSSDKFCSNCGNSLKSIEGSIKDATSNIKGTITSNEAYKKFTDINGEGCMKAEWENDDMVNFIQKNTEYYIPKFKEMQDFQKGTSWNWASFFLTSNWFFYRKIYGYGVGLLIAHMIFALIPFLGWILNMGTCAACGLYGNNLYLKHVQKQLNSVDGLREDVKRRTILSKGGTNLVLPLVVGFTIPILIFIFIFLGATLSIMSSPYYY